MVVRAETKRHIVDVEEVHKLTEHYRQVHSSIGLYIHSWVYIPLGSFPQVADFAMTGLCNPSLTCIL